MAGVTGTNGKTTTTFLIKHICESAGLPSGLIGTVRYYNFLLITLPLHSSYSLYQH
jgi:UDP-N-acetylmuramyl tripeptide synthase